MRGPSGGAPAPRRSVPPPRVQAGRRARGASLLHRTSSMRPCPAERATFVRYSECGVARLAGGADMKLLIDAVAATGGAGVVRLRELARWFPALAPDADLVFVVRPEIARVVREQSPDLPVWTMRPRLRSTPPRLVWEHLALPRRAQRFVPDVVFSPFNFVPTTWPEPRPRLAVLISNLAPYSEAVLERCRRREVPRLLLLRALTSRSAAVADRVFIVSRQALDLVPVPGLAAKSVLVPHSPPPPHPASATVGIEIPRVPYLVVAAELYKWKGVETVIEAVALLKNLPHIELIVCGRHLESDYVAMLRRIITRLGLTDRVRLEHEPSAGRGDVAGHASRRVRYPELPGAVWRERTLLRRGSNRRARSASAPASHDG
jgi:glycosyltransferase involved in cell wall biosynthesis